MEKNNLLNSLYEKADKMREAKIRELRVTSNAENLAYGSNSKRLRDALEDITTIRDACIEVIMFECDKILPICNDNEEKTVKVRNIEERIKSFPLKGTIKITTFFTGFWDSNTNSYSSRAFEEVGKQLMLDEINKAIFPLSLRDVSDPSKSTNRVFTCTIPPRKN